MRIKYVVLGLALLGGLWSCALDWDHLWMYLLHVPDPINFSGTQGRPFHTVGWFLVQSVLAALVLGHIQSRLMDRRMKHEV